jgi:hypothetical protein
LTPLATNGRPSGAKNAPQKPPPPKAPARADPPAVEPPVVGRPVDYSGAVGGPFVVEQTAEPTELNAEEPLTLTVRITGPGNLRDLPRPPLAKLDAYKAFAVDNLDDRFVAGDPPRREFRYRLRPRTADVKEVPRLKFVYFNSARAGTPSRGYQTTYADPVPLTVRPRTPPAPDVPAEVPEWMLERVPVVETIGSHTGADITELVMAKVMSWFGVRYDRQSHGWEALVWLSYVVATVVLIVPPLVSGAWYWAWRRANPSAAQRTGLRRSRAAAVALRSLRSATDDPAHRVAAAVLGYLRDRAGLPATVRTPHEVAEYLSRSGSPTALEEQTIALLRRCDGARFAPSPVADGTLAADTERVILDWEAMAWNPP